MSIRSTFVNRGMHLLVVAFLLASSTLSAAGPVESSSTAAPSVEDALPHAFDSPLPTPQPLDGGESVAPQALPDTFISPLPTPEPLSPILPAAPPLRVGVVVTATVGLERESSIAPDGVTTLHFPAGAVREAAEVRITRLAELPAPLPRGVQYGGYGLDVQVREEDGDEVDRMEQPVTVVLRYAGLPGIGNATSQRLLKLYHYDEGLETWTPLPTEVSVATGVLTATTTGFSPVLPAVDTQADLGDYAEPWSPTVQDYQVDLFTGAATWGVPLDVPTGRGGLAPSLGLSYSSGIVDGMRGRLNPQAGWAGAGWSLGTGYVARVIERENGVPTAVSTYTLVFDGVSSELIHIGGESYATKDERFWRIEYRATSANRGGDDWLITDRGGITYRFGHSDESFGSDSQYSAWWMVTPGDGSPQFQYTNWRWNLDRIEDTHGNRVDLRYQAEHNDFVFLWDDGHAHFYTGPAGVRPCGGSAGPCLCQVEVNGQWYDYTCHDYMAGEPYKSGYVVGGHLDEIVYSEDAGGTADPAYRVEFVADSRYDYPDVLDSDVSGIQFVQTFWSKHRLQAIKIKHASSGDLIRKVELEHAYLSYDGDPHYMLILNGVWPFGSGSDHLPPTTFSYHAVDHPSYEWVWPHYTMPDAYGQKPWLAAVQNGYGGSVGFDYILGGFQSGQTFDPGELDDHDDDPNTPPRRWFRYRVRGVTAEPGIGPQVHTEYQYRNETGDAPHAGDWDEDGAFLGHPRVRAIRRDGEGGAALATSDHYFHQGSGDPPDVCSGGLDDREGLEGREYRRVHYDGGGQALASTVTRHRVQDLADGRRFTHAEAVCTYAEEGSGVSGRTEYAYDTTYGNLVDVREYDDAGATSPYRTTRSLYAANEAAWILDRPKAVKVFNGDVAGGQTVAVTRYFYDRDASGNLRPFGSAPTAGDLARVERRADLDANVFAAVDTWVDQWGNPTQERTYTGLGISGAPTYDGPRTSTTSYDTTYEQFPVETCAAVSTDVEQCTQIATYAANDPNGPFGQVERVTGPNGAETAFRYDAFGRLVAARAPDDAGWEPGQVTARYEYLALGQVGRQRIVAWGGRDSSQQESLFDGLGRTVQVHERAGGGQEVRTTTGYDALGRAAEAWAPGYGAEGEDGGYGANGYVPPAGLPHTTAAYDRLGRVIQVDRADGTTTWTYYDGRTTTGVDANGHQTRYTADAFGQMAEVVGFEGVHPNATAYATTRYGYDVLGNLAVVTNTDGITIGMTYDDLGRKAAMDDPDMGHWEYRYDAVGNLVWQEDAKGQRISFEYDELNRLVRKTGEGEMGGGGEVLVE